MKRKLFLLSILVICVASLAAGSLAYFNADGQAHNVITTGGVEIKIQEWANADKTEAFTDLDGILPGATVTKIAEVKNTGASEAWVRVKVTKAITLTKEGNPNTALVELDLNETDWTLAEDGYLYCNQAVKPGETTAPIFTTVTFNKAMGNEYQNATATVDVYAQAVQTANNGKTAQEAKGWPLEETKPQNPEE